MAILTWNDQYTKDTTNQNIMWALTSNWPYSHGGHFALTILPSHPEYEVKAKGPPSECSKDGLRWSRIHVTEMYHHQELMSSKWSHNIEPRPQTSHDCQSTATRTQPNIEATMRSTQANTRRWTLMLRQPEWEHSTNITAWRHSRSHFKHLNEAPVTKRIQYCMYTQMPNISFSSDSFELLGSAWSN